MLMALNTVRGCTHGKLIQHAYLKLCTVGVKYYLNKQKAYDKNADSEKFRSCCMIFVQTAIIYSRLSSNCPQQNRKKGDKRPENVRPLRPLKRVSRSGQGSFSAGA